MSQPPRAIAHKICPAVGGSLRMECELPEGHGGFIYSTADWDDVTCDDCLRVLAARRAKMEQP